MNQHTLSNKLKAANDNHARVDVSHSEGRHWIPATLDD